MWRGLENADVGARRASLKKKKKKTLMKSPAADENKVKQKERDRAEEAL